MNMNAIEKCMKRNYKKIPAKNMSGKGARFTTFFGIK